MNLKHGQQHAEENRSTLLANTFRTGQLERDCRVARFDYGLYTVEPRGAARSIEVKAAVEALPWE